MGIDILNPRTDWLSHLRISNESKLRMFCFPYAGAGPSVYKDWPQGIANSVDLIGINYPGREALSSHAPMSNLNEIVGKVAVKILPYLDKPFVFFGHSMGAYVSFELARILKERQGFSPEHIFLSAASAPHIENENPICALSGKEFLRALVRLNGFPIEAMQSPELVHYTLPTLRADFTACETYRYQTGQPIDAPLTVYGGDNDPRVAVHELEAWKHHSAAMFSSKVFQGGHFYLRECRDQLLDSINQELIKAI